MTAPSVAARVLEDLPEKLPAWFGDGPDKALLMEWCVARREFSVPCNWKFLMENTCETTTHRESESCDTFAFVRLKTLLSWPTVSSFLFNDQHHAPHVTRTTQHGRVVHRIRSDR